MIETLPLFHRIFGSPVIVLGEGEAAEAKRRLVERAGGLVCTDLEAGIAQGARLAFIALEEADAAERAVARARHAGILVNATDRPALCDFTVPSILDRSPVLIAVGSGGASAGLAKHVRLRLEALLPSSLGILAKALYQARGMLRQRFPHAVERRVALDDALRAGGALDPFVADSAQRVDTWLSQEQVVVASCVDILLRSPDPDDLTLREARALGAADVIYHSAYVSADILNRARADAVRYALEEGQEVEALEGTQIVVLRQT